MADLKPKNPKVESLKTRERSYIYNYEQYNREVKEPMKRTAKAYQPKPGRYDEKTGDIVRNKRRGMIIPEVFQNATIDVASISEQGLKAIPTDWEKAKGLGAKKVYFFGATYSTLFSGTGVTVPTLVGYVRSSKQWHSVQISNVDYIKAEKTNMTTPESFQDSVDIYQSILQEGINPSA